MKETRDACRELEYVAEDRENRLIQLERSLAEVTQRATSSEKECEELRSKYQFQVEVSQRVARHYHTLQNSTKNFQALYQTLEASLEQSRQLFAQSEDKICIIQALQSKVSQSMIKKREMNESLEKMLRLEENRSGELQQKLNDASLRSNNLQAQCDTLRETIDDLTRRLKAQTQEQAMNSETAQNQAQLIESLQVANQKLKTEINGLNTSLSNIQLQHEPDPAPQETQNVEKLNAQIELLQTQVAEMAQHRAQLVTSQKTLVDSIIQQRDAGKVELEKIQEKVAELERENADLRELLARRNSARAPSNTQTTRSSTLQPTNRNQTFGQSTARTSTSTSNNGSTHRSKITTPTSLRRESDPIVLNDSVMEIDEEFGKDPLRPFSPFQSHPLDLLGDANTDLLQYRGLKCCGEPVTGMTITCSRCRELFHLSCVEAIRNKAVPKKQKFVCYLCDPALKSPKTRRPRLTVMDY